MPSPTKALLDANVLFSNHLRNLLLQMAQNDMFDVKWSAMIETEWLRNMKPRTRQRIEAYTLALIRTEFADALVTGFKEREVGNTDAGDRHVASAAAAIAPCVLVTDNLKHFDADTLRALDVTVRSPDDFLCDLFEAKPKVIDAVTREACANLMKPVQPGRIFGYAREPMQSPEVWRGASRLDTAGAPCQGVEDFHQA
jgi:hypothetical protein